MHKQAKRRLGCKAQRIFVAAASIAGLVSPAYVLVVFSLIGCTEQNGANSGDPAANAQQKRDVLAKNAAVPPPPPLPVNAVMILMTVEMPDGRVLHADVIDGDCPQQNTCDYYGIHGYVLAGFKKMNLNVRESCVGRHGAKSCEIVSIGGLPNSAKGKWTLYRNGHRNVYPFNQITRETAPEHLVFKFRPNS